MILRQKKYQFDGHDMELVLKYAKAEAIITQSFNCADDITELYKRMQAMEKSGKITFEELRVLLTQLWSDSPTLADTAVLCQIDVLSDIRNFAFDQLRTYQETNALVSRTSMLLPMTPPSPTYY